MIVETNTGRIRGAAIGEITAFRGIPYARAARFAAPQPVRSWAGVRDAVTPGPAAPQPPSRLQNVMGPFEIPQSEDCLSLNIWAPRGSGHPVLVFLHGGGFSSGSGGLAWYDGTELAARGDLVVVTVNYRLGALGFLRLPGVSDGNLGLLDQLSALHWVRDNIAAFGGDPHNVTVAGQSAGAMSILALLSGEAARGLIHRAILQSTPAGMLPDEPDKAAHTGGMLLRELGIEPSEAARLGAVPLADLLAAQLGVARRTPANPVPPFQLVVDTLVVPDPVAAVGARGADGVPILLGTTRDEAAAFFPDGRTTAEAVTVQMFSEPTQRLARLLTAAGAPPWQYRFDWHPADSPYGACHCIELPFVLGDEAAWRHAPMLRGQRPPDLVDEVRDRWIGFARSGDPGWARGTSHRFTKDAAVVPDSR
jgi:para-nitrobenzyl esterase